MTGPSSCATGRAVGSLSDLSGLLLEDLDALGLLSVADLRKLREEARTNPLRAALKVLLVVGTGLISDGAILVSLGDVDRMIDEADDPKKLLVDVGQTLLLSMVQNRLLKISGGLRLRLMEAVDKLNPLPRLKATAGKIGAWLEAKLPKIDGPLPAGPAVPVPVPNGMQILPMKGGWGTNRKGPKPPPILPMKKGGWGTNRKGPKPPPKIFAKNIDDGTIRALAALELKKAPEIAKYLDGKNLSEIMAYMKNKKYGKPTEKDMKVPKGAKYELKQLKWELPDGTVVRVKITKPTGNFVDEYRKEPAYSVSVRKVDQNGNSLPDSPANEAFKLDRKGRPIPARPEDVDVSGLSNIDAKNKTDDTMDKGHITTTRK